MRKLLILLCLIALTGCQYDVPVVKDAKKDIDQKVLGLWESLEKNSDDVKDRMLILKFSDREYLVHYPSNKTDGIYFKAFLIDVAGMTLVQLQCLATGKGELAGNDKNYALARYTVNGEQLQFQLINTEVVSNKIKDSEKIKDEIENNKDNPELFDELVEFKRQTPE